MILSIYTILFEANNSYYIFNSESLFFSEISEELYSILNGREWTKIPEELLENLKDKKIIIPDEDKYVFFYATKTKFLTDAYGSKTMTLVIAPTTGCNFECPYCFEPKKNPRIITKDVESKIIDFINDRKDVDSISLTWYGGEPLLMADAIERLYNRIKEETDKTIIFQDIITNAYLITDKVIDMFRNIGINSIQISLDGIEKNHNKTRFLKGSHKPTYKKIKENIKHLAQELPELSISLRVNIKKSNCDDFVKIYEEYHGESWHKNIFPYPGIIREDTPDGCRMCHTSYNLSEMVGLYEHFKNKGINVNFFPKHRGTGCMLQRSKAFIIGPEGEIYKCWNDVSNKDRIIGNIMDNKLYNYHLFMRYMHESGPFDCHCRDCEIFPICDGGCGMLRYRNMFENGEFIYCSPFKSIESLKLALLNSTKDNPDSHKKEIKI